MEKQDRPASALRPGEREPRPACPGRERGESGPGEAPPGRRIRPPSRDRSGARPAGGRRDENPLSHLLSGDVGGLVSSLRSDDILLIVLILALLPERGRRDGDDVVPILMFLLLSDLF